MRIAPLLVALVAILFVFPLVVAAPARGEERVVLFVSDLPLLALIVAVTPAFARAARQRALGTATALWSAAFAFIVIAFIAHPSLKGVEVVLRAAGTLSLAFAVTRLARGPERTLVVAAVGVAAAIEGIVAALQIAAGRPLGLEALGEWQQPLYERGSALAPRGTTVGVDILTGLAVFATTLLARRALATGAHWSWAILAVLAALPIGITFSRAAAVASIGIAACLAVDAVRRRPQRAAVLAAVALAIVVPAVVQRGGWQDRADQVVNERPADALSDRRILVVQGLVVLADEPLVGVGPGLLERTLDERRARGANVGPYETPDDVPLTIADWAGVPAGTVVVVLLAAALTRAWRRGPLAMATLLSFAISTLAHDFPVTHDMGIVLTGLWLGQLDVDEADAKGAAA